jgi:hypothetical protein
VREYSGYKPFSSTAPVNSGCLCKVAGAAFMDTGRRRGSSINILLGCVCGKGAIVSAAVYFVFPCAKILQCNVQMPVYRSKLLTNLTARGMPTEIWPHAPVRPFRRICNLSRRICSDCHNKRLDVGKQCLGLQSCVLREGLLKCLKSEFGD